MANYRMEDARFTAIYFRTNSVQDKPRFVKVPFELVRYNVDSDPDALPVIVPDAERFSTAKEVTDLKVYEDIWFVDSIPWDAANGGKHDFGMRGREGQSG